MIFTLKDPPGLCLCSVCCVQLFAEAGACPGCPQPLAWLCAVVGAAAPALAVALPASPRVGGCKRQACVDFTLHSAFIKVSAGIILGIYLRGLVHH